MNPEEHSHGAGAPHASAAMAPAQAVKKNTVMAALAYLGILVVVSYFVAKDDPFVKFHIKQGLLLLILEAAVWILGTFFWAAWMLLDIVNLVVLVLAIIGIVNAVKGEEKPLPVIGHLANQFRF